MRHGTGVVAARHYHWIYHYHPSYSTPALTEGTHLSNRNCSRSNRLLQNDREGGHGYHYRTLPYPNQDAGTGALHLCHELN